MLRAAVWILAAGLALPTPAAASYRYVASQNLIVIEQGASATLTSLKSALPSAPLTLVDRDKRIWLLSANLLVTGGGSLRLHGRKAGGDVEELRLKSENARGPGNFVSITADHGVIDIRSTRVTSWDSAANGPDREHETYGRAFLRARSRMRSMLLIPLQSRMDITDSEVAFLGYNANESYGLVWKVVAPDPFVFDYVRVHGNVVNSRIHDNYFGLYSAGARGSEWRGNRIYNNVQYGFAPHNRSDDLRIEDNDVFDNGHHGISVRQSCARVIVKNNRVWGNGGSGITLHRGSNRGQVIGNRIFRNFDTGVTVYSSSGNTLRDNIVRENGHIGISLAMGASDNRVEHNEIGDNGFYGLFVGKGRGRPKSVNEGNPRGNHIAHNVIWGSGAEDLRMGDAALNTFADNSVTESAPFAQADAAAGTAAEPAGAIRETSTPAQ